MRNPVAAIQPKSRFSRRSIISAGALLASVDATAIQVAPAAPDIEQARQSNSRHAEAIARVRVERHVEPAFRFEA